jgi:hypothetical protein
MGHLKIMKLMSHIDEAIDILVKHNFIEDAEILSIFSRKYHTMYQLAARDFNGNSQP